MRVARYVFNSAAGTDGRRFRVARPVAQLRAGRTDWYSIKNLGSNSAEVYIYDEIGYWGVTAQNLIDEIKALNVATIELHINSPGGEVFDGIAIHNALRAHPATVNVTVDALAASIASVIAMAGDTVTMARGATMMIHDGMGITIGNAADHREMAVLLDQCSDNIAGFYAEKAGGTTEHWRDCMRTETWYTADEAVSAGLADKAAGREPDAGDPPVNSWDLTIYGYAGRDRAPAPRIEPVPAPVPPAAIADPVNFADVFRKAFEESVTA